MRNKILSGVVVLLSISSFSLTAIAVEVVDKTISMAGWLSPESSELTFSEPAYGITLKGSTESDCDFSDYQLCENGESNLISDSIATSNSATIDRVGYYEFSEVGLATDYIISTELFKGRSKHKVVSFQDKIWVIGGQAHDSSLLNDIWASHDGYTWIEQTSGADFTARYMHEALTFNNKLWIFGGIVEGTYQSDIWSSDDGINWQEVVPDIAITMSGFTRAVTFDNKMWLFDFDSNGSASIYSSSDGSNWSVVDMPAGLTLLTYESVTEYKNKLRIFGSRLNNIQSWVSTDGINWSLEDDSVFGVSAGDSVEKVFIHDSKICLIESSTGKELRCSESGDADSWTSSGNTNLTGYDTDLIVNLNETLYLAGGDIDLSTPEVPPLQTSINGRYWGHWPAGSVANIPPNPEVVTFGSKLVTAGSNLEGRIASSSNGFDWKIGYPVGLSLPQSYKLFSLPTELFFLDLSDTNNKKVYSSDLSSNGGEWEAVATSLPMDTRARYAATVFNNKLWVIGGYNTQKSHNSDSALSDVWSSADGVVWNEVTSNANFSGQENHQVISFSSKMWLLDNDTNAIWYSSDGETWVQSTAQSVTPAREFAGFTAYQNKLWILGGKDSSGQILNDIWSSVDGINWTRELEHALFPEVSEQKLVELDDRLFMIGGESKGAPLSYIWSTIDGVNWVKGYEDSIQVKTEGYNLQASASDGGEVEVITPIVARGTIGSVEIDPDNYYSLEAVSGCEGSLNDRQNIFTTNRLNAGCTLDVSFKQSHFLVSTLANNSNLAYITPSFGRYTSEQSVTFEIVFRSPNLQIDSVTGCGGTLSGTTYQVDGFDKDCQIDAVISVIEAPVEPVVTEPELPIDTEDEPESPEVLGDDAEAGGSFNVYFIILLMLSTFAMSNRRII